MTGKSVAELVHLNDIPDLSELPADDDSPLSELTPMQLRYVEGWLALAGQHGAMTRAAEYAGYAQKTWSVVGSKLNRDPRITAAIKYLAEKKAHTAAYASMGTLEQLQRTGTDAIRLKAAQTILSHAGIIATTIHQHEHIVKDSRTQDQVEASVMEKLKDLGLGDMIDVSPKVSPHSHEGGERKEGQNQGAPRYKQKLIPNRMPTDDEIDEMDWMDVEV